jgi:hypothetical protein
MPKVLIDYSNTIIYKKTRKDQNINDVYVGHTTNFVQRKHAHKNCCYNEKTNDCKLYQAIRNNGGWNNWNMEIVNFFNCKDHYEARKKEQEYFELLNATLNSIEPMPKPKFKPEPIAKPKPPVVNDKTSENIPNKYSCEVCNFITSRNQDYEMHLVTAKHKRNFLETNQNLNIPSVGFHCNECNFTTLKKNIFEKHQNSIKHIRNMNKEPNVNKHICDVCNKKYLNSSGLWKHKKTCQVLETKPEVLENKPELINELREPDNKKLEITMDLVVELLKQNRELIELVRTLHQENH